MGIEKENPGALTPGQKERLGLSSPGPLFYYNEDHSNVKTLTLNNYTKRRNAWAWMMSDLLRSYKWDWWVTLTSWDPQPIEAIRGRYFWWFKILRKKIGKRIEHIWVVERQRRGALHIHSVIYFNEPAEKWSKLWSWAIDAWQTSWSKKNNGRYGFANIKKYDHMQAGKLSNYLAKERCKDLDVMEGSGSLFEKLGFSRGVRRYGEIQGTIPKDIVGPGEAYKYPLIASRGYTRRIGFTSDY